MSEEEKEAIEEIKKALRLAKNIDNITTTIRNEYAEIIVGVIDKQQKEIEKYKRYFKLAISDLQSEGYMQMPFKNIENYYSKREDIV